MNAARSTTTRATDSSLNTNSTVLALRPKEAAKALGIGQRLLWQMSQPRGPIPCVRVGCCVLYPRAMLEAWLTAQASNGGGATREAIKPEGGAA